MRPADVVPLHDVSPADWLVQTSTGRQGRVRDYLPEGYQAYLRLPLIDADGEGVPLRQWLGILRDVLARHTGTPDRCWFSLWEGWPVPQWWRESAPTFHLPHREHLLFAGGLEDLLVIASEFACAGVEYPDGSFVVDMRGLDGEGSGPRRMPERYPGNARLIPRLGTRRWQHGAAKRVPASNPACGGHRTAPGWSRGRSTPTPSTWPAPGLSSRSCSRSRGLPPVRSLSMTPSRSRTEPAEVHVHLADHLHVFAERARIPTPTPRP